MLERIQAADVAHIYRLWTEVAAAVNAGDLERWLSLWSEHGIQMLPGAPRRVGKAEIRAGMRPLFDQADTRRMVIQTEEVRILGDRAYAHGTYEFERAPQGGAGAKRCVGQFLDILERQLDGSWKIAIDCHNHSPSTRDA
ncbi:MAG: nuclear transport factor 2 family protein [Anaerolineae bacterium]|jgi:uncharacterized protein (TIGR02246 family)